MPARASHPSNGSAAKRAYSHDSHGDATVAVCERGFRLVAVRSLLVAAANRQPGLRSVRTSQVTTAVPPLGNCAHVDELGAHVANGLMNAGAPARSSLISAQAAAVKCPHVLFLQSFEADSLSWPTLLETARHQ